MSTDMPAIETLTLLKSHTSGETAYVQPDYPYGRYERCQRRVWVETNPNRGMRYCTQTSQPSDPDYWNKPKKGNYVFFVCMLLDEANGYIYPHHLSEHSSANHFQKFWTHCYSDLEEACRKRIDGLGRMLSGYFNREGVNFAQSTGVHQGNRIEAQVEWFYDEQNGLEPYVYAQQVGEGNPEDLPVVSAQRYRKRSDGTTLINITPTHQITQDIQAQARQVAAWDVADYPKAHWCYAVLRGFRGFSYQGNPIYDLVQQLMPLPSDPDTAQLNGAEREATWKEVWAASEAYWEAKVSERLDAAHEAVSSSPVGATYNLSHATCQN